jgi:hypothetical protein
VRPAVEPLEDRSLLSAYVVNDLGDAGAGSGLAGDLRYVVTQAVTNPDPDGDTITFQRMGTVELHSPLPELRGDLLIQNPWVNFVTVERSPAANTPHFGIFSVAGGATVTLSALTLANGYADGRGGGIANQGNLTVTGCVLTGNSAPFGGGIYNVGTLTVEGSILSDNHAVDNGTGLAAQGGGINNSGALTVTDSSLERNSAAKGGGLFSTGPTVEFSRSFISHNYSLQIAFHASYAGGIENVGGALTLTDCVLAGNSADNFAGGIFSHHDPFGPTASLAVVNCTLTGNRGGAINSADSTTITNSTIAGNANGGVVHSFGNATLTDCAITGNGAIGLSNSSASTMTVTNTIIRGSSGTGGLHNSGTMTVTDSTVADNTSNSYGGGVVNGGDLTLVRTTISGNRANLDSSLRNLGGGGIFNRGRLTVIDSTVADNAAVKGGGIFNNSGGIYLGALTITGSTLSGNSADGLPDSSGGAVWSDAGAMVAATNDTFYGNRAASRGGAIALLGGSLHLTNLTIDANQADGEGGGVYVAPAAGPAAVLNNTIVALNRAGPDGAVPSDLDGTVNAEASHNNLVGDGTGSNLVDGANGNLVGGPDNPLDPGLGPLQDNGGPTLTQALLSGSPAAGAADDDLAPATDQRGLPRFGHGHADIGAYETQDGAGLRAEALAPVGDWSLWASRKEYGARV